jgi:hypothetical protein
MATGTSSPRVVSTLRAVWIVLPAQVSIPPVEQLKHRAEIRGAVEVVAYVLGGVHRVSGRGVAVLDERVALWKREAQLRDPALAVQHAELELLVANDRRSIGVPLDAHTRPVGELDGELIDDCRPVGHALIVALDARRASSGEQPAHGAIADALPSGFSARKALA